MKTTADIKNEPSFSDCLMDIMPFLVWAADFDEIQGGVHAKDALDSFRQLLDWDKERFDALCEVFRAEPE